MSKKYNIHSVNTSVFEIQDYMNILRVDYTATGSARLTLPKKDGINVQEGIWFWIVDTGEKAGTSTISIEVNPGDSTTFFGGATTFDIDHDKQLARVELMSDDTWVVTYSSFASFGDIDITGDINITSTTASVSPEFAYAVATQSAVLTNTLSGYMKNVGFRVLSDIGSMVISLTQGDGVTNPVAGMEVTQVSFNSFTPNISGVQTYVDYDTLHTVTIPGGATLGFQSGSPAKVFVYVYANSSGEKGLAVSSRIYDESTTYSTTALSMGSDDDGLYAGAARLACSIRLIGEFSYDNIVSAGWWDTPDYVSLKQFKDLPRGLINTIYFTSSGTYYPNPYADFIDVICVAGGGGSGGIASTTGTQVSSSGGGGGGETAFKRIERSSLVAPVTVTIGAGGSGGASGNNDGSTGGTSSFGAFVTALGGGGGGGGVQTAASQSGTPGSGGSGGSGGDLYISGGDGSTGRVVSGQLILNASGGNSYFAGTSHGAYVSAVGQQGKLYGGGAGGSVNSVSQSARAGADGGDGIIIVKEYKS